MPDEELEQDYENVREGALSDLRDGEPRAAYAKFRGVLEWPPPRLDRKQWRDALEIFGRIVEAMGRLELAERVRKAARAVEDAVPLYDLGLRLLGDGMPAVAATVLSRARGVAPGSERLAVALATALGRIMRWRESTAVLREAEGVLARSPHALAQLALHALMTGDLDEPRALIESVAAVEDPEVTALRELVEGMLARAGALEGVARLDGSDLRGWHFVITGGILLHLSPFGGAQGMNGRYAWTQDAYGRCLDGLRRLQLVLEEWGKRPSRVFLLPDGDSAILAHAASRMLGAPLEPWPAAGTDRPGLVVVYDLAGLRPVLRGELGRSRPGQLLWNHAACFTNDLHFAGDFTTFLHQMNTSPWRAIVGTEAGRDTEKLAREIVDAAPESSLLGDFPELLAFARAVRRLTGPHAASAFLGSGPRRRMLAGGPVGARGSPA